MIYLQFLALTIVVLMFFLLLIPFIPVLRRGSIKFFNGLDTAELYVHILEEREANELWPTGFNEIYTRLLRNFLAYVFMFMMVVFASFIWPLIWAVAFIGLLAVPVWYIKNRGKVSTER